MADRITRNTFQKGLNTDTSKSQIEPVYYTDAHNLEIVGDGEFFALKNIRGTLDVQELASSDEVELATFETFYKIGTAERIKCLTIFTFGSGTLKIWCYDTENDILYQMYQGAPENAGSYLSDDRFIQVRGHAENGIDILYFTDNWSEIRQLRCEIPTPYTGVFLTDYDLSLTRRGANGRIATNADVILDGGSLLSGTYQFAYRMVDPTTKKFTKWSSLTNPIHVYATDTSISSGLVSKAGIGLFSNKKIRLDINPTQTELDNFDYFQLAVVENIYPFGANRTGSDAAGYTFIASLLQVTPIAERTNYEYKSNQRVGTIPIEDIVVDLAPIKSAKTLAISGNKLYLGNLEYNELELDNGNPVVTTGSILTETGSPTLGYDGEKSTNNKGYFRDEVYRFGIVFFDKFGNKSAPYTLDMTNVAANAISGATDMKFPARSSSNSYSLLNASHQPRTLGLSLTIDNVPTWAEGFEIVRVKRIKRILFQSPVIPFMSVQGVGALYEYPTKQSNGSFNQDYEYPNAQPMTSSEVYVPKNMAWPELRNITKATANALSDIGRIMEGEVQIQRADKYSIAGIYPPSNIYSDTPYNYFGGEILETIDYVLLNPITGNFSSSVVNTGGTSKVIGEDSDTSMTFTFYGLSDENYYFNSAFSPGKVIPGTTDKRQVTDYTYFDNLSEGGIVGGNKVLQYGELTTQGVVYGGQQPSVNKMAVVQLSRPFSDEMAPALTFTNTLVKNAYAQLGFITNASGVRFALQQNNNLINTYPDYVGGNSSYTQCIRIVNTINDNVNDSRYGSPKTEHEFISTGTVYSFNPSELAAVQAGGSNQFTVEVWGGDCFVTSHVFKICDTTYAVTNQSKNWGAPNSSTTVAANFGGRIYRTTTFATNSVYCIPVTLKNNAQYLQVYLESEYNGEVLDARELDRITTINGATLFGASVSSSESKLRTPLSYIYNINLNKENDQKVYFSKPQFTFEQNVFNSRIIASDQKIYNSDQQGFDVFRVLNTTDLEESKGPLTKLVLAGDDMYAIQERGIVYLPSGQTQLEQTDGGILSVGTGSDIGRTIIIDTNRGGQNIAAIAETGSVIYIPDVRNKSVYQLANRQLNPISSIDNDTLFRSLFSGDIQDRGLRSVYDPLRKQYWLFRNETTPSCYVFNEALNQWVGNYEFDTTGKLYNGAYANNSLFLVGVNSDLVISKMYEGDYNVLFGRVKQPRVTFYVNPDNDFSKTFDNMMLAATDRLATVDAVVERESSLGNQVSNGMILDVSTRGEGNYRIKVLRDAAGARLRGLRMKATVKWLTTNVTSALNAVYNRYRLSNRSPF